MYLLNLYSATSKELYSEALPAQARPDENTMNNACKPITFKTVYLHPRGRMIPVIVLKYLPHNFNMRNACKALQINKCTFYKFMS